MKLIGVLARAKHAKSPVRGTTPDFGKLSVQEVIGLGSAVRSVEVSPLLDAVRAEVPKMIANGY
jgi:hypothetical protein